MTSRRLQGGILLALTWLPAAGAHSSAIIRGRAMDGEAGSTRLLEAVRSQEKLDEGLLPPLAGLDLFVEMFPPGEARLPTGPGQVADRTAGGWKVKTGPRGEFEIDTGLQALSEGTLFAARAVKDGRGIFSPFFPPPQGATAPGIYLYPTTDNPQVLQAALTVVCDVVPASGDPLVGPALRVRSSLQLRNHSTKMYVGRVSGSQWREIWRLPFPPGAKLLPGPSPGAPAAGWTLSEDGHWLILDAPVPGLCDLGGQTAHEAHYLVPARRSLLEQFPTPVGVGPQQLSVWCVRGEVKPASVDLRQSLTRDAPDPFNGSPRPFEILYSSEPLAMGETVSVLLTLEEGALGWVSGSSVLWVLGFVLVVLAAGAAGLVVQAKQSRPGGEAGP